MKTEFFIKRTGEILEDTEDYYFIMNDVVYRDNGRTEESQARVVGFYDFIEPLPHVGWRVRI